MDGMSTGKQIAGAGAVLLLISLFLTWIDPLNGWEVNNTLDIYLLITAGVAIAAAFGVGLALDGVTMDGATALLGAVAVVLLLWLVLFDWPDGADRGIGVFLALIGSVAVAYGGWRAAP